VVAHHLWGNHKGCPYRFPLYLYLYPLSLPMSIIILILGDLLAIAAVGVPFFVLIAVGLMALGRVRLGETIGYWFLGLLLNGLLGWGLVAKLQTAAIATDPNGLLLRLSNNTLLTLLGVGLFLQVAAIGIFLYLWNK
jgi:hypothetical protein